MSRYSRTIAVSMELQAIVRVWSRNVPKYVGCCLASAGERMQSFSLCTGESWESECQNMGVKN